MKRWWGKTRTRAQAKTETEIDMAAKGKSKLRPKHKHQAHEATHGAQGNSQGTHGTHGHGLLEGQSPYELRLRSVFAKLGKAIQPPRMASIGSKLCPNAFQTIPDILFSMPVEKSATIF